ncbi:MAG: sensor histidine kinase [Leptolyngbyaceae cyanobacterium]
MKFGHTVVAYIWPYRIIAIAPMPDRASLNQLDVSQSSTLPVMTLGTDSTLQALPLHQAQLGVDDLCSTAVTLFNQRPELPGLLLCDANQGVGVLSRQRFFEYLLRPKGRELFFDEPLSVIHSYARLQPLVFTQKTLILVAARAALRRPTEFHGEPLLVKTDSGDRLLNAHDLNQAHWQIRGIEIQVRHERTQAAMLQTHKMAALGRLVDGIAHEIMDPLGFIWGNLSHVDSYCQQLLNLIKTYESVEAGMAEAQVLAELKEDIELNYLRQDLPSALQSIKGGAARLKQLASSLQNFCHIDEVYPRPVDLHELIDSIVLLLKSRLNTHITITRQYAALPPVPCFPGQLSQVLMNLLSRCIDELLGLAARQSVAADFMAMAPATPPEDLPSPPEIVITTRLRDRSEQSQAQRDRAVVITIADNGPGLSPVALQQIRAFFSIRHRLERETDLAFSYQLITAKHGGKFSVRSPASCFQSASESSGTEYEIQLPLFNTSE